MTNENAPNVTLPSRPLEALDHDAPMLDSQGNPIANGETPRDEPVERCQDEDLDDDDKDSMNEIQTEVENGAEEDEDEDEFAADAPPSQKPKMPKERKKMVHVDHIYDPKKFEWFYVKSASVPKKASDKKLRRYVIVVSREHATGGGWAGQYIVQIRGEYLIGALKEIFQDVSAVYSGFFSAMDAEEVEFVFHARHALAARLEEARREECPNQDLIMELEAGVEFVQDFFSETLEALERLPPGHITFDLLWTVFPAHTLVFHKDALGQAVVHRVKRCQYHRSQRQSDKYELRVDHLDSDGHELGRVFSQGLMIIEYKGPRPIAELNVFPLQNHPDHVQVRKDLVQRGDRLLGLHGRHLQEYSGHALSDRNMKFNSHGRIILDPSTYGSVKPHNVHIPAISTVLDADNITDDEKMTIWPLLYGFSLGDKMWGAFAVTQLEDVAWNDTIVDSLVLQQDRKDFILSLVRTHGQTTEAETFDDFVRDKGKGLIGLLAGPPGTGKTLTAEAIAETARRPLYVVSSGELGETSDSVQRSLAEILELAEAWNAVLLLDEADVFLARRTDNDLGRNAIVSIFLRQLEYYQGILLLTTNRSDSFDQAFQSRIHFYFEYDDLTEEGKLAIWQTFLDRARNVPSLRVELDEADLRDLSKLRLNGRQIKNCMGISQAVATERKAALNMSVVRQAVSFAMMMREGSE